MRLSSVAGVTCNEFVLVSRGQGPARRSAGSCQLPALPAAAGVSGSAPKGARPAGRLVDLPGGYFAPSGEARASTALL